jgi:hypothetical protein
MKTAGSDHQNRYATMRSKPNTWSGNWNDPAQSCGLESKKTSGRARGIFLDFPLPGHWQPNRGLVCGKKWPLKNGGHL